MIPNSLKVAELYKNRFNKDIITVVNCRFIKPIDEVLLNKLIDEYEYFVTIEEGVISGGFGSSILEYFNKKKVKKNIKVLGIDDQFTTHGDRESLLKLCNLDIASIDTIINELINE